MTSRFVSMTNPLISVLIPCFNAGNYLREAVLSVLCQNWEDLELIVVDDGSSDNSVDVLRSFDDCRLSFIKQSNAGAAAARNRAFFQARGKFVMFLDADDWIPPTHLTALHSAVANEESCIGMAQWDRFYTKPEEARFPPRATYRDSPGSEWLIQDWSAGGGIAGPGMFLIPRDLIERCGGWDERLSLVDDFEFHARIIAGSGGVKFAPEARLYYRSGLSSSLSGRRSRKAAESAYLSLMLGTQHLLDVENNPRARRTCANVLQNFEYGFYPDFPDLRAKIRRRVAELGGADLAPSGPPGFQKLRPWVGWRAARRIQLLAEHWGINRAVRTGARRTIAR